MKKKSLVGYVETLMKAKTIKEKPLYHGDKCPICGDKIIASGFNGELFCWGKCYCYVGSEKYQGLLRGMKI